MAVEHSQKVSLKTTLLAALQSRKGNDSQADINSFVAQLKNIIFFRYWHDVSAERAVNIPCMHVYKFIAIALKHKHFNLAIVSVYCKRRRRVYKSFDN